MPTQRQIKQQIVAIEACLVFVYDGHDKLRLAIYFAGRNAFINDKLQARLQNALNHVQQECAYLIMEKTKLQRDYENLIKQGAA